MALSGPLQWNDESRWCKELNIIQVMGLLFVLWACKLLIALAESKARGQEPAKGIFRTMNHPDLIQHRADGLLA